MRGLWLTLALVASPGCSALCSGVASAYAEAPSATPWLVLVDPRPGMDKHFGSPEETGTLLAWHGWRTEAFGPRGSE